MTDNQRFALLIFALVVIGVVLLVYLNIGGGLARML